MKHGLEDGSVRIRYVAGMSVGGHVILRRPPLSQVGVGIWRAVADWS